MGYVTVTGFGRGAARYLVVRLGERAFAMDLDTVREIRAVTRIDRLPDAPAHVRGWIDIRGESVTVVDLARLLAVGEWRQRAESSLVVLRHGEQRAGLLVDRAVEITEVPDAEVDRGAAVAGLDARWVAGVLERPTPLVLLDVDAVLAALEAV